MSNLLGNKHVLDFIYSITLSRASMLYIIVKLACTYQNAIFLA